MVNVREDSVDNSLLYTLALSHCEIAPVLYSRLLRAFGSAEDAWKASGSELVSRGLPPGFSTFFCERRRTVDPERAYDRMVREGVHALLAEDSRYPAQLSDLYDQPYILYYRGILPIPGEPMIAVVGTRRCSSYGAYITQSLVPPVAQAGCTIVSGLALGVDALAHKATLEAKGRTVAVLGCGVDKNTIGPRQNTLLAEDIIERDGCILSEYPVGTGGRKEHFPMRNRIVAALSRGVLVVEAPEKSGALITADIALSIAREVCAVPGAITNPLAAGTNQLIQNGAHCILSARDLIELFDLSPHQSLPVPVRTGGHLDLLQTEKAIVRILAEKTLHIEEIASISNLDMASANSTLLLMELKGLVVHVGGMMYKSAQ